MVEQDRRFWVVGDVRDAFGRLPLNRLLDVVRFYLPDDKLVRFVETVLGTGKRRGVRQGGPMSPLMLNLYLHHVLDYPWSRAVPGVPLLRYSDDILVLADSRAEAVQAHDRLSRMLLSAGMPLKAEPGPAVRVLNRRHPVEWLGYSIRRGDDGLDVRIRRERMGPAAGEAVASAPGLGRPAAGRPRHQRLADADGAVPPVFRHRGNHPEDRKRRRRDGLRRNPGREGVADDLARRPRALVGCCGDPPGSAEDGTARARRRPPGHSPFD